MKGWEGGVLGERERWLMSNFPQEFRNGILQNVKIKKIKSFLTFLDKFLEKYQ